MTHLDQEFLKQQKLLLLKEKERLENELKILEKFPQFGDQEDDNAEEVDQFYSENAEDVQMLTIYKNIRKALKKIENGTYAQCDNCKKEIPIDRLKAIPWATTCLDCDK